MGLSAGKPVTHPHSPQSSQSSICVQNTVRTSADVCIFWYSGTAMFGARELIAEALPQEVLACLSCMPEHHRPAINPSYYLACLMKVAVAPPQDRRSCRLCKTAMQFDLLQLTGSHYKAMLCSKGSCLMKDFLSHCRTFPLQCVHDCMKVALIKTALWVVLLRWQGRLGSTVGGVVDSCTTVKHVYWYH